MSQATDWAIGGGLTYGIPGALVGYGIGNYLQKNPNNAASDWMYNTFGLHSGKYANPDYYDVYGKNVDRGIATELGGVSQARYTAAQQEIANKFAQARTRALQSAQNRGLQTSGFAQQMESDLYGQQAQADAQVYAGLLQEEQNFLDQQYNYDKQMAFQMAMQQRQEALARQKMWQDFLIEGVETGTSFAIGGV